MFLIVILAFIGLVSIFLEFFLPGMVLAVIGVLLLLSSMALFFLQQPAIWGLIYCAALLLSLIGVCKIALVWMKRTKEKNQFYLQQDQEGYLASVFDRTAIGKKGEACTELKPSGYILIDGQMQQALCESGYLPQGTAIHVIGGQGGHLIVKEDKI